MANTTEQNEMIELRRRVRACIKETVGTPGGAGVAGEVISNETEKPKSLNVSVKPDATI